MTETTPVLRRRALRLPFAAALLLTVGILAAGCSSSSATSQSAVTVNGSTSSSAFHDGESVTVSVGPNKIFTPHLRVNILECADPGGLKSKLPTQFLDCDGNTIEANSILPASNGSFTEKGYVIYRLPSVTLGEGKTYTPVCDTTHQCVLYVGQDQDDFSKPKEFSAPFTVTGGKAPTT
jgi:hypothetical protein